MGIFSNYSNVKRGYERLWSEAKIRPEHQAEVHKAAEKILRNRARYEALTPLVPWWFIGIIQHLEAGSDITKHMHNGNPLVARTVDVPANRPAVGEPPFTWEESAMDALQMKGFLKETDWSFPKACWHWELYNGLGYVGRGVNSPYVWSFTSLYDKGKYVADGVYDANTVSKQCGTATLLKQLIEMGEVKAEAIPVPVPAIPVPAPKVEVQTMSDLNAFLKQFSGLAPTLVALAAPLAVKVLAEVLAMDIKSDAVAVHDTIDATAPSKVPGIIVAAEAIAVALLPPPPAVAPVLAAGPAVAPSGPAVAAPGTDTPIAPVSLPVTPVATSVISPILTGFDALFPWLVGYKTGGGIAIAAVLGAIHYMGAFPTVITPDIYVGGMSLATGLAGIGLVQKIDRGMSLLAMFRSPAMVTVKQ